MYLYSVTIKSWWGGDESFTSRKNYKLLGGRRMKMITLKKIMSLVLVAALIIGGINLGARKVSAEGEEQPYSVDNKAVDDAAKVSLEGTLASQEESAKDVTLSIDCNNTGVKEYADDVLTTAEIVLLVDLSNSMSETDVQNAKSAIKSFVEKTFENPRAAEVVKIGVVTFNSSTNVLIAPTNSKQAILDAMYPADGSETFKRNSGTYTKGALYDAADLFSSDSDNKIIVLMSDGVPNIGKNPWTNDSTGAKNAASTIKGRGIDIYTIAYGANDSGKSVLSAIASAGKAFETSKGAEDSLVTTFGIVSDTIGKDIFATFNSLVVTLTEGVFSFDEDGEVFTMTYSGSEIPTEPIKVYVQKSANDLAEENGVTDNVVEFKGVDSIVLSYTFKNDTKSLEINDLKVKAAVNSMPVQYYVETVKENSAETGLVETDFTVYTFVGENDFVLNNENVKALSALGEYLSDNYKEVVIEPIMSEPEEGEEPVLVGWKATYELKTSLVYFVDALDKNAYTVALDEENSLENVVAHFPGYLGKGFDFIQRDDIVVDELNGYKFRGWSLEPKGELIDVSEYGVFTEEDQIFYAVYEAYSAPAPMEYSVRFLNNDGQEILENVGKLGAAVAVPEYRIAFDYAGIKAAYTTYTFYGWADYDASKTVYTLSDADNTVVTEVIPEFGRTYIAVYKSEYNPPSEPTKFEFPPFQGDPTPTPTAIPTPEPTPVPTEAPTPTEEPIVVEEPETPEGDVEIDEIETPEGAPEEEELDVEPIDTPQGDLPKTGVLPTYAFIGIGAACVLFGSILVIKRRKEEN